ncbi:MAG: leucine-rich repeat protein [Clostridia bacterium]|nr:leucine-rich repeat protein [Clostridia bacterium]
MEKTIDKSKLKIIVISAAAVLLLTIIIVTVACINANNKADGDTADGDGDSVGAFAEKDDGYELQTASTTQSASQMSFESNGDGTCTLVSVNGISLTDVIVPAESPDGEAVSAISDKAFENCASVKTISIPATVKSIASGAFAKCSSLVSFNVNSSNTKYCAVGGVLFSKDKTVLVCYPAMKVGTSYLLSTNVKTISAYAFGGVTNLKTILYEGSSSKFNSISVEAGNEKLSKLSVTYNYVAAK